MIDLRDPLTVDDLRGLTLAQLDRICSVILGVKPPRRPVFCCEHCLSDWSPLYGPPPPVPEWLERRRAAMRARRRSRLVSFIEGEASA